MSRLIKEIFEQPEIFEKLLANKDQVEEICNVIIDRNIRHIYIAARGSSDNAGRYAKYIFGINNSLPVTLATPSIYSYYNARLRLNNTLTIGISQSGQSPDIIKVLKSNRSADNLTLAITNSIDSELARSAEKVLYCYAGEEKSIAATKTYTSQLFLIAMLSACLKQNLTMIKELHDVSVISKKIMEKTKEIDAFSRDFIEMEKCIVISRGYNYSTAFEFALKIKEIANILALPYSPSDFLHGPITMIGNDLPCILIAPKGKLDENIKDFVIELKKRKTKIIIFTDNDKLIKQSEHIFYIPILSKEWVSPIYFTIIGQLFSYFLSKHKGLDPEKPKGLIKITKTL